MLVDRAYIPAALLNGQGTDAWPFTVACVRQLMTEDLSFTSPVTFLVGENGSGKSTLVEAVAEAYGLDAHGGRAGRKYGNDRPKTPLGEVLKLEYTATGSRMATGPRAKKKGFFLRAETAFGLLDFVSGMAGYWEDDITTMSHGEGFLTVFSEMFQEPGLYLMDEPEAALSFTSCLQLVALMRQLGQSGAQIICATHSPILAATPGADIVQIDDDGMRHTTWEDLDIVEHWRQFLNRPESYLRHLDIED